MVPRGARNERRKRQQEQHKTTRNNKVPRIARNEDILPRMTRISTNGFLAGLGTKEGNDNKDNIKQQGTTRGSSRGSERKKETTTRTTLNNKGQQGPSHSSERRFFTTNL